MTTNIAPIDVALPPTIGVDPGQTWTAAVLRIGGHADHGWTIGPVDKFGTVRRDALNQVDNWDHFALYVRRLRQGLDELRAAFSGAGVKFDAPIVTSCGSGVSAAVLTLALYRLGVENPALYDGSWTEWGAADGPPVATGPA